MSTEWVQILVTLAIVTPLVILTGRYLMWRRWDRERRINRLARRQGLKQWVNVTIVGDASKLEEAFRKAELAEFRCQDPEQAWIEMNEVAHNPGFSMKVPCQ